MLLEAAYTDAWTGGGWGLRRNHGDSLKQLSLTTQWGGAHFSTVGLPVLCLEA